MRYTGNVFTNVFIMLFAVLRDLQFLNVTGAVFHIKVTVIVGDHSKQGHIWIKGTSLTLSSTKWETELGTLVVLFNPFTRYIYLCFILSIHRRLDYSAAIQELFSFHGIGTSPSLRLWQRWGSKYYLLVGPNFLQK